MAVGDDSFDTYVTSLDERLETFLGQILGEIIEDVLEAVPDLFAARPQVLKTRHFLPINLHRLREHLLRTHPQAMFAVFLPVDDVFFQRLAVPGRADDVAFIGKLLDDLGTVVNVDEKLVYTSSMSNGGMMCYRLAAELSERIAAVAPVAGTLSPSRRATPNSTCRSFTSTARRTISFPSR